MLVNNEAQCIDFEFKEFLYVKKHPFSDFTLNVNAVGQCILLGKVNGTPVPQLTLIALLEHHANLGEANAQKTLYSFLKQPLGKIDFTDPEKAANVLALGLKQERMWAIKEKIKELIKSGKGNSFGIVNYYIMAAHQNDKESEDKLSALFGDKIFYQRNPLKNPLSIENEFSIKKYLETGFGTSKWTHEKKPWTAYGSPLTKLGREYISIYQTLKTKKSFTVAKNYFKKGAELGCKDAMVWLGTTYEMDSNFKEALNCFEIVAKLASEECSSSFKSVLMLANQSAGDLETKEFHGHAPNLAKALSYFYAGAELGDAPSMVKAAHYEAQGFNGHLPNIEKAMELWLAAAELGNEEAMLSLASEEENRYHQGLSLSLEKALFWYKKAASNNNQAVLKVSFIEGFEYPGHPANELESCKWAELAANKGIKKAMVAAGFLQQILKNDEKALFWHKLAAKEGYIESMYAAACIENKFNNHKQANYWLELAANNNHPEALCDLAFKCLKEHQHLKAFNLFVKAAELGSSQGIFNTGVMEIMGFKGHPANPKKALEWFLKEAANGNATAMYHVARIYLRLHDYAKAVFWLNKSDASGCQEAGDFIEAIISQLKKSDEELIEIHNKGVYDDQDLETKILPSSSSNEKEKLDFNNTNLFTNINDIKITETVDSQDWEEELNLELAEYPDFSTYQQKVEESLNIRTQFQQLEEINNRTNNFTISLVNLSNKNKLIWESLNDPTQATISLAELIHFTKDEAFGGQFFHCPTASGIMFCLTCHNKGQKRHGTVSTHRKHNKSYKGVDKNFAKEFRDMVLNVLSL